MLDLKRALRSDSLLLALTGLNRREFAKLLPSFEQRWLGSRPALSPQRQRAPGAGRKPVLFTSADKLFFVLFYLKSYPTFALLGCFFGLDESEAHRWLHKLRPVLEKTLGQKQVLPERKIRSTGEFICCFPAVKNILLDGTERRSGAAEAGSALFGKKEAAYEAQSNRPPWAKDLEVD